MIKRYTANKKKSVGDLIIGVILLLLALVILVPFIHILSLSFSPSYIATKGGLHLIPKDFTLDNYVKVLGNSFIWRGYKNTLLRTAIGTPLSLMVTALGAYALSKKTFPNRQFWTIFVVFTMFFTGGLIPTYLLVKNLGIMNTYAAMILPRLTSAYYLIIMRNFFQSLPEELEESCMIDGANRFTIFFKIVMPLSKPIFATIGLWLVVSYWNEWYEVMLYIQDEAKFVLQIVLRRIIISGTQQVMDLTTSGVMLQEETLSSPEGLKSAAIFVATLPILCVYPFIQKYFVKGIMIGSLKG